MLTIAEIRDGVRCPHCGIRFRPPVTAVAVASRHCPDCGRRVADEAAEPGRPTVAVAELAGLRELSGRMQGRMAWAMLSGFLGMIVLAVPVAVYRDTIRGAIGPDTIPWLMLVPFLGGFVWFLIEIRRASKVEGQCPHCRAGLWR